MPAFSCKLHSGGYNFDGAPVLGDRRGMTRQLPLHRPKHPAIIRLAEAIGRKLAREDFAARQRAEQEGKETGSTNAPRSHLRPLLVRPPESALD